jgi:hypothetical protein
VRVMCYNVAMLLLIENERYNAFRMRSGRIKASRRFTAGPAVLNAFESRELVAIRLGDFTSQALVVEAMPGFRAFTLELSGPLIPSP